MQVPWWKWSTPIMWVPLSRLGKAFETVNNKSRHVPGKFTQEISFDHLPYLRVHQTGHRIRLLILLLAWGSNSYIGGSGSSAAAKGWPSDRQPLVGPMVFRLHGISPELGAYCHGSEGSDYFVQFNGQDGVRFAS